MQLITVAEVNAMKNKLSPFAASIAAGLEEAITHAKGEQVPGIRVTEVPDVKRSPAQSR